MSARDVTVDRLSIELRVAAVPSRAFAIERRIREATTSGLERALERRMAAYDDVGIVFVDVLELAGCASTAWDDDRIVEEIAHRFEAAIGSVLRSRGDHAGHGVRRFRDHPEWVAAYLLARVEGTAGERWWFDDFEGLRLLPLSAAIRTLVEDEEGAANEALLRLAPAHLAQVVAALETADASRVLAAWAQRSAQVTMSIAELWLAAQRRTSGVTHDVLHSCIELERRSRGALGGRTVTLVTAFAAVVRVLTASPTKAGALLEAPPDGLARWSAALGIDHQWLSLLTADEIAQVIGLIEELRAKAPGGSREDGPSAARAVGESTFARTNHGGIFALAVVASWLDWPARWQRQFARRRATRDDADALSRALVVAVCAHALSSQPQSVLADPAVAAAFAMDDPEGLLTAHAQPVFAALRGVVRGDATLEAASRALLAKLAERVPGCRGATTEYLRSNLLDVGASIVVEGDDAPVRVTLARAPLHVLLMLAGLTRATFTCVGRRFALATEEGV